MHQPEPKSSLFPGSNANVVKQIKELIDNENFVRLISFNIVLYKAMQMQWSL